MKTSNELFEELLKVKEDAKIAILAIFNKLNVKKLNVLYYEENYAVETTGFSSYTADAYSSPSWVKSVRIDENDLNIIATLDGDWEHDEYFEDLMVNESVILLDVLEQCLNAIEEYGAKIAEEYIEED